MARPLRIEFPGAIHHISARTAGNWKQESNRLFKDDRDRLRFIERLGERVEQFEIRLYLLTLMTNHFHLVAETPRGNLGKFMQSLSTAYTVYFNRRHRRHGHLLDGRYKAKLVEGDEYLLNLTRYVHLNPVHTTVMKRKTLKERVEHLRNYRWSSYQGYIGRRKPFEFIDCAPVLAQMKGVKRERPRRYRQYVETGLAEDDHEFKEAMKESPLCIGGKVFRGKVNALYDALGQKRKQPQDLSFRRIIQPLPSNEILKVLSEVFRVEVEEFSCRRRDSALRSAGAWMLCRYGGLSQRETATVLGVGTGAAVSRQLARLPDRLQADPNLAKLVKRTEKKLKALQSQ